MKEYQEKNLVKLLITFVIVLSTMHTLSYYFSYEDGIKRLMGFLGLTMVVLLAKNFSDWVVK